MSKLKDLAFLLAALTYILLPTDLAPDFWPLVGWIDDVLVLAVTLQLLWKRRPRALTVDGK